MAWWKGTASEVAEKVRNGRLKSWKGAASSRAVHRFQRLTARLGSRALSKLRRRDFFRNLFSRADRVRKNEGFSPWGKSPHRRFTIYETNSRLRL